MENRHNLYHLMHNPTSFDLLFLAHNLRAQIFAVILQQFCYKLFLARLGAAADGVGLGRGDRAPGVQASVLKTCLLLTRFQDLETAHQCLINGHHT